MPTTLTASVRNQLRFAFAFVITLSFLSTATAVWRLERLSNDASGLARRLDGPQAKALYAQVPDDAHAGAAALGGEPALAPAKAPAARTARARKGAAAGKPQASAVAEDWEEF